MKKILLVIFTFLATNSYAQIFSQDFQSSTTKTDYIGSGSGQFNSFYSANSASTTSDIVTEVGNNFLRFDKTGSTTSVITRNTTLNNSATVAVIKYKIRFTGIVSTTQSDILAFFLGDETAVPSTLYTNNNIDNINAAANLFGLVNLRCVRSDAAGTITYNGANTSTGHTPSTDYIFISAVGSFFPASNWNEITLVVNKTASAISYTGPNGLTNSIPASRQDVWIGTTKAAQNNLSTSATLTTFNSFKVRIPANFPNGNIDIDDIDIYNDYSVLPVTFTAFSGKKVGSSAQLSWQTTSESNNSHFNVLRAGENGQFYKIGKVKGGTNTSTTTNYSFTDFNPTSATNYYKLQQVNFDGTVNEHNDVVALAFNQKSSKISVSAVSNLSLNLFIDDAKAGHAQLLISDISGKIIANKSIVLVDGSNKINVAASLSKGIYIATLQNIEGKTSIKFSY